MDTSFWYVQCKGKLLGLFPERQIQEFLLLGRIDRLKDVDLSYAILRNVNMTGAAFENVNLGKVVWVDVRVCKPGSINICQ